MSRPLFAIGIILALFGLIFGFRPTLFEFGAFLAIMALLLTTNQRLKQIAKHLKERPRRDI